MKITDLKWAAAEMARAALGRQHVDCECHPRLTYKGPRSSPDKGAPDLPASTSATRRSSSRRSGH